MDPEAGLAPERQKSLTRRQLLERSLLAGGALALPGILAACGGSSGAGGGPTSAGPTAADATTAATTAAAGPKPGGTAVVALSVFNPKSTLDPARATSDFDLLASGMLFDNLVKLDTSFNPQPALAESWEATPDASAWTFSLRQGVEFHDGAPFSASDVAYTLERVLDPASESPAQSTLAANLEPSGIKVVDPATIELSLTTPNAFFPVVLGGYNLRIVKDGETDVAANPIGTGPFAYDQYTPGEIFVVKKNASYWQDGLPYLDGIRVQSIPEQAAKVQAVLSGDVDIADAVDIPTAIQLEGDANAQLYTLKSASFNVIAVQAEVDPYTRLQIRQALKHGLDRERLVNVVLQGHGVAGADIPVAADDSLFPAGFAPLAYDPEKAKSLLAEAGFADGLPVTLFASDAAAYMVQTATAFQDIVKDAGIAVEIEQVQPDIYFSDIWMQRPCFSSFWLRQHPSTIIAQACVTDGVWNESQFRNADFDRLVAEANATTDVSRQQELYAEAMPLLADQSGWIIPQWGDRIWPAKPRLVDVQLDFIDNASFTKAYLNA